MLLIVRSVSKWYPELFLILAVLIYWILTATLLNPIAIILVTLLNAQLAFKSRILGLILSTILLSLTAYLFLALFFDVFKADNFIPDGLRLLFLGGAFMLFTGYFSFKLLRKNLFSVLEKYPLGND